MEAPPTSNLRQMVIALLVSATAFPAIMTERWHPRLPPPERLVPAYPGSWYHFMKNYTTEHVGHDANWWSRCLMFSLVIFHLIGLIVGSYVPIIGHGIMWAVALPLKYLLLFLKLSIYYFIILIQGLF